MTARPPRARPIVRILVVDDYQFWRFKISLILQARPELQVIAEVSDGSEAVRKAEELRPDLILMDISMPQLNGIDAARQIRRKSPNSKIIFLSAENAPEIVQVALSTGAHGYVCKAHAQRELLPAIDAALPAEISVPGTSSGQPASQVRASNVPRRHEVQFYAKEGVLLDRLVPFIKASLQNGGVILMLARESHWTRASRRLRREGVDIDAAIKQRRCVVLDIREVLSNLLVNGTLDPSRFFNFANRLLKEAGKKGNSQNPRIAVYGELVSLLCEEGKPEAAIALERLWNTMAMTHDFDILCGYSQEDFQGEGRELNYLAVCAEHSAVHAR